MNCTKRNKLVDIAHLMNTHTIFTLAVVNMIGWFAKCLFLCQTAITQNKMCIGFVEEGGQKSSAFERSDSP